MPRADQNHGDPHLHAVLEAVEATLAGEPVEATHAELAELTLLLADERPVIEPRFAGGLDRAVQRRFAVPSGQEEPPRRVPFSVRRRWWLWSPAVGLTGALVAAIVIVVGGAGRQPSSSGGVVAANSAMAHPTSTAASQPSSAAASSAAAAVPLGPLPNGRKIIQSSQLALSTAPSRIEQVAQEVFIVVGQVRGIVSSSTVTATGGPGAYAQFQLSIPSSMLAQAMASLSSLQYAKVTSRTDATQDVNDQYQADVRALADARALRSTLLRQLANAVTQAQIDSLTARIHDAEASIASDEATLRSLNRQIDYTQVGLTVNGGALPVPVSSSSTGGFGLGKAAHDAGRVLTVAAGIVLIGLAGLVPVALLTGVVWWCISIVRRRRREHVLDLI